MGLNPSKFSLLLNQFFINAGNFITLINEILLNNFPIKFLEFIFENLDELELKFHFYVIVLKKGSALSTSSKFLIIPKGLFYSHLRSNLWVNFCDKILLIFMKNIFKTKKNLGIVFILIIYYLEKIIKIKLQTFINFRKFYTKEERLESIGNYYQLLNDSFKLYIKSYSKISKNELYFTYTNILEHYNLNLELKYYSIYLTKSHFILKNFNFFELDK